MRKAVVGLAKKVETEKGNTFTTSQTERSIWEKSTHTNDVTERGVATSL